MKTKLVSNTIKMKRVLRIIIIKLYDKVLVVRSINNSKGSLEKVRKLPIKFREFDC